MWTCILMVITLQLPYPTADPHRFDCSLQSIFASQEVVQVNIAAASGDMGILANHVPSIEPLRAGIVEVVEPGNATKKWFGA